MRSIYKIHAPQQRYCGGRNASCVVYFLSLSALLSTEQPFWVLETVSRSSSSEGAEFDWTLYERLFFLSFCSHSCRHTLGRRPGVCMYFYDLESECTIPRKPLHHPSRVYHVSNSLPLSTSQACYCWPPYCLFHQSQWRKTLKPPHPQPMSL